MLQPVAILIGLRHLSAGSSDGFSYLVSWFAAIGVLLGVTALVVVLSVMNGFERQLTRQILQVIPQALLTTPSGQLAPQDFTLASLQGLSIKGMKEIAPLTLGEVVLQSQHGLAMGTLLGIDPQAYEPLSHHLLQGQIDALRPHAWQVILGVTLAQQLGLRLGDQLRLIATGARQLTPLGQLPSQRLLTVAGLFAVGSSVDSTLLLVNYQDAGRLLRYPSGSISGWRLFFDQPLQLASRRVPILPAGLVWQDWQQSYGDLFQAIKMEKVMMGLLLLLIIAVAAFNIITASGMQVMERATEVAILQTQGLTPGSIMLLFIVQGASRAVIGTLAGGCIGWWLVSHLNRVTAVLGINGLVGIDLPVVLQPPQVVTVMLIALAATLLATIYPAWRAATLVPTEVLRHAK